MFNFLLPKCDVVFITGTTLINGTLENILEICLNAREIILMGASCPMFPKAFKDTKITVLAGSWWDYNYKENIFKKISLAGGISELREYSIKKTIILK